MNDKKIKGIAAELLRNKDQVFRLLDYLRPEDVERGLLILPDELVNNELRPLLLDRAAPYLTHYRLTSTASSGGLGGPDGLLFLDLDLSVKQLGRLQARYMICISQLTFRADERRLAFRYREDLKSSGNPLQSMALKALLGDKTLLMKACEMAGLTSAHGSAAPKGPAVSINKESASMDLNRLPLTLPDFLDAVTLQYDGAGEGFLRFRFAFQ